MPVRRQASARFLTFSTTFCSFACWGAPESAKAPPSTITSFCRSWMISTVPLGSSFSGSVSFSPIVPPLGHERLAASRGLRLEAVETGRRAHEHPAPVSAAPVEVADRLGDLDRAQVLAFGRDHPDACGPRHPEVPELVALHPVDEIHFLEARGADVLGQHAVARRQAVGLELEHADVCPVSIVDVEQRLVRREAKAVGLDEIAGEQLQLTPARRNPVHALKVQVLIALDPEPGHAPVRRIAEVDRPGRVDDDVVRAVQLLALVVRGEYLPTAPRTVGIHPHDRARRVLAHEQPPVRIQRHAVALVARAQDLLDAGLLVPAPPRVARHVGEQQEPAVGVPDRALGEGEAAPELLDLHALVDELVELARRGTDAHARLLSCDREIGANLTENEASGSYSSAGSKSSASELMQ